ncbi:MAG: AAA family ATPase [Planctomycetaceae bacterium]|nr:AAA family ATPase [Planctomycetaceae bacterium]
MTPRHIKGIRIKNYRVLRDISLGAVFTPPSSADVNVKQTGRHKPLLPLTAVIGRNGYGKSTFCDALGFIVDCLRMDAEGACNLRGGFDRIVSENSDEILEFQICCGSIQYTLNIAADEFNVPYVFSETLSHTQQRFFGGKNSAAGSMNFFVKNGEGKVVLPDSNEVKDLRLADRRQLVLATLGNLSQFPDIVEFRNFLDGWYLCCFEPDEARKAPMSGPQRHLNRTGSNLANVILFWERHHTERLHSLTERVLKPVLGITKIETHTMEDGRLLVKFYEQHSQKPFYAAQMSDGTLKLVAYMLLLGDPDPLPLVCFEEPESGLYHKLFATFVEEIRRLTEDAKNCSQFFITTHQPYLVDMFSPQEVYLLEKGTDGYAQIRRTDEDPIVKSMVEEGMTLGALWCSEYLED